MTIPRRTIVDGARAAMRALADRSTPLIRNEWYVAAFAHEVGRTLLRRTLLGTSLVLFRTTTGLPVAMDNRCPHRSYPLSSGHLDGDTLACGYHGMRFDTEGNCIELPAIAKCPKGIGVRTYPVVEKGAICWIWMGAQDPDLNRIPAPHWMADSDWAGADAYYHLAGSYVSLHENLLDTSHLSFLHAKTIGSPDYVRAPTTIEISDGRFALNRLVYPTRLPEALVKLTGLDATADVVRAVRNEFLAPGYYEATTLLYDKARDAADRPEFSIRVAHMPTPETLTSTHYFIYVARNFAQTDALSHRVMVKNMLSAFEEDVIGLAMQEDMQRAAGNDLYEVSFESDALTIAMRRYLKLRANAEQLPAEPPR